MMMSLSAVRIGRSTSSAFSPTVRKACRGFSSPSSSIWVPRRMLRDSQKKKKKSMVGGHGNIKTSMLRYFSTMRDDYDDDHHRGNNGSAAADLSSTLKSQGHADAAKLRSNGQAHSHDEAWMVNLGRDGDNAWLTGPREEAWFTGLSPDNQLCPGVDENGKVRSIPLPNLSSVTRQAAKDYFDNSWTLYETLFAGLNGEEGFYRPPVHGLRHPQIFYYGHTACLYVNKLRVSGVLKKPVNAYFESIFEVGVDEMLWDDMNKNDMLWPTVSEVHQYRQKVYETVVDAIMTHDSLEPSAGETGVRVNQEHPMWALFMGYEHERIHFETSSVLFRETPYHLVQAPKNWPPLHPSAYRNNDIDDGVETTTYHPVEGNHYPSNRMISVVAEKSNTPQGNTTDSFTIDLGKPADFPSYGWDNEYGERQVTVPSFSASEHMITNGEYWHFVNDGGYRSREYWCDDGWAWRTHRNMKWPFFWESAGPAGSHEYHLRTIFEIIHMPWDWPVDVNYYEAKAYCRWKTTKEGSPTSQPFRILTEAEHHVIRHQDHNLEAARKDVNADSVMVTSGQEFDNTTSTRGSNLNLAFTSQNPVDYFQPSHTGHKDTTGNAWEWTEDHFNPLKGFEVHHVYDDFSTPCFDGKHSMIVGGSFMSTGDEASVFARFHFRPHFLQHSGFRLVASDEPAPATHLFAGNFEGQAAAAAAAAAASAATTTMNDADATGNTESSSLSLSPTGQDIYESEESLHMYLGLHYPYTSINSSTDEMTVPPPILPHGDSPDHALRFPQRVANLLTELHQQGASSSSSSSSSRALDVGCSVGGSSFELAKTFDSVDSFDFSESFVQAAKKMQAGETIPFRIPMEAELFHQVQAVHDDGVTPEVRSKVRFFTGDATKVGELEKGAYDGVLVSNLLCRLPDPMAFLNGLPKVVSKDGVVVFVTPFSWLLDYTPRSKWLGGFNDPVSNDPIRSSDVLQEIMEQNGFTKIHQVEVPVLIREHQRKYQYIVSEATGWQYNNNNK